MKIIKKGLSKEQVEKKLKQTKRFSCGFCECVFEADKNEYKSEEVQFNMYYYCICPNCSEKAYEVRIR